MSNQQQHNLFGGEERPIPVPPPAEAWDNMRRKLDDEMPVTGMLLPDNIITAGTGFINSITALFTLLFIGSMVWWFSGTLVKGQFNNAATNITPLVDSAASLNKNIDKPAAGANTITALPQTTVDDGSDKQALADNSKAAGNNNHTTGNSYKHGKKANNKLVVQHSSVTAATTQSPAPQQTAAGRDITTGKQDDVQPQANNMQAKAKTPAAAAKNSTDSAAGDGNEEVHVDDKALHVTAGLQWQAQLPFSGAQHYFAGPNAASQPYRLLIPGAWVGFEFEKNLFTLEFNPFTGTVYNPKPFITTTEIDGQTETTKVKSLNKLFGLTAAIRYSYNVKGNWWAGGGIQGGVMNKGVATVVTETNTNGTKMYNTSFARLETSDMAALSKFKVRTDAEVFYRTPKWQAGVRAGVYFTPATTGYTTQKNPLELSLFYRWQIWSGDKKRH